MVTEQFYLPNPQVHFFSCVSLPHFLLQLNLSLSLRLAIPPIFSPFLDLTSPLLPSSPHLSCTVTDPSGNCFESARHFCVVAVYLCWGHGGPEPQFLSVLGREVKLPNSFTALRQETLILDQCGFTV